MTISRRVVAGLVALALALALSAGCARNDGRAMTAPPPGATTPPPTASAQAVPEASPPTFAVSSPAFSNGGLMPADFTCDGTGGPPPLTWTTPPPTAVELAVVLTDADDAETALWVVAGLPPEPLALVTGSLPAGAFDLGYDPPCPEPGEEAHVYVFTVHGLTTPLGIGPDATPADALARLAAIPSQAAQLTAFYGR